jgi:hypothetical protein
LRKIAGLAVLMLSIVAVSSADHAREWQMSTRKPEGSLAGIQVGKTSITAARKILGEPTRFRDLPDYPGEAEYVWERSGTQLTLGTQFDPANRTAQGEIVESVELSGTTGSRKYATGAGVKLGDGLQALIHAYGPVYLTSWRKPTLETTTFTFLFQDDTELSASLSDEGKIVSFLLVGSE